jgi:hypothetical protein
MKKFFLYGLGITFIVFFNVGYVFHDLIMGNWFHTKIGHVTREQYIIPLIGLAYFTYCAIQTFLFPIFYDYSSRHWNWSIRKSGIWFGLLIGFTWDALEGGLIEYATMPIPIESFLIDSTYHTIEGGLLGLILAIVYKKWGIH